MAQALRATDSNQCAIRTPRSFFEDEELPHTVLFGGGSAGGLATYLGADRVGVWLREHCGVQALGKELVGFKALPVSGWVVLSRPWQLCQAGAVVGIC